jgi:hypothetical protein
MQYRSLQNCGSMKKRPKTQDLEDLQILCKTNPSLQAPLSVSAQEFLLKTILCSEPYTLQPSEECMAETNRFVNNMALVCKSWHNAFVPTGDQDPLINRWVTLGKFEILHDEWTVRPWWRCVRCGEHVTDTALASLATGCTKLTSLHLGECRWITNEGIASLAAGCPEITDKGIASLAAGCPEIKYLNLEKCRWITDKGIASLAAGCPEIKYLNVCYCKAITDDAIAVLVSGLTDCDVWTQA